MCALVGDEPVRVSKTSIFARHHGPGRQYLAYSMRVAAAGATAMILPVPVPPASADDALRFVDLSGYPEFFTRMNQVCHSLEATLGADDGAPAAEPLQVHDVGAFEASFVPGMADLDRLDPRFRLPPEVWARMPDYRDWGFAVFQLKLKHRAETAQDIHPMAFDFPTRDSDRLFFPTVHVHDGAFHETADFDHSLYCQRPDAEQAMGRAWSELSGTPDDPVLWLRLSGASAADLMQVERSAGLLDPALGLSAMDLVGRNANRDVRVGAD